MQVQNDTYMKQGIRINISGGGTGGHIFPAISIANAIKQMAPEAEILFVGAEGRMEMQRVPAAGYDIKGLPICGFDRKNLLKNIYVLFKIWKSQRMAKNIIKDIFGFRKTRYRGLAKLKTQLDVLCASANFFMLASARKAETKLKSQTALLFEAQFQG